MKNQNIAYVFADGNLTSDPEKKTTPNGKSVTSFTIAVNHINSKDSAEPDVSFFDVEAWEKLGDNCSEYLKKGSKVTVIGLLKQDRWKTTDGSSRSKVKVSAQQVRFDYSGKADRKAA
ncbi:MAG: single-stranded DNA-binding protein [Leptospira sp.]|nr:single-stranded DNA-binding protein [Leptospira sp.]